MIDSPLLLPAAAPGAVPDSEHRAPKRCASWSSASAECSKGSPTGLSAANPASGRVYTPKLAPRVAVPLITPRYQRKARAPREMIISDSSDERLSAAGALGERRTEDMLIRNGPVTYTEEIHFQPYDLFRTGKNSVYRRSVGYSSDGELVVTRDDQGEVSKNDLLRRQTVIDNPVCLNPRVPRPLTEEEEKIKLEHPKRINAAEQRYKKYPGVRAPRNKKVRNRLMNDHFASEYAKKLLEKAHMYDRDDDDDDDYIANTYQVRPIFGTVPKAFLGLLEKSEDQQLRTLKAKGVSSLPHEPSPESTASAALRNPDSGEARFTALSTRLKGDLQHALGSQFLTSEIEDLERTFTEYITSPRDGPLEFRFRDGYGRLICHGVAAYYQLLSRSSAGSDGLKTTYVSLPRNRKKQSISVSLPQTSLMVMLRRRCPSWNSLKSMRGVDESDEDVTPIMGADWSKRPIPIRPVDGDEHASGDADSMPAVMLPPSTFASTIRPVPQESAPYGSAAAVGKRKAPARARAGKKPAMYRSVTPTLDYDFHLVEAATAALSESEDDVVDELQADYSTTVCSSALCSETCSPSLPFQTPSSGAPAGVRGVTQSATSAAAAMQVNPAAPACTRNGRRKKKGKHSTWLTDGFYCPPGQH